MTAKEQTATFNLKAVIQETGLKPDTLRAWERRYGLPQPKRTPGGHRLYSQHDIDMLKWLVSRQDEGLSISRAVALWKQLESEDQDPLRAPAYAVPDSVAAPAFIPGDETIAGLRQNWFDACMDLNEARAEQVLNYALALFSAETVCFEILLKGLAGIGDGWYQGDVTVQQEHFASELSMRRVEALIAASPAPTRPGRILIGCAPEDTHAFVPLLLTFLMKQRGWEVLYLGARVPAERIETTLGTFKPNLVILTAQQLTSAASLLAVAKILQREKVPFAFGGMIFNALPELHRRVPGHFLGTRLETAPQLIEGLLTSSRPSPSAQPASDAYIRAKTNFLERRNLLEAELWQSLGDLDISPNYMSIANQTLAHNINAALALGDVDYLCTDIAWIEGLLDNFDVPRELLHRYAHAYYEAAQRHLTNDDNPVLEWLAELSGKKLKTEE